MTPKELSEASWELAEECLDILPNDNLPLTGLALIHLIGVWLNAIPEAGRAITYMQWLDMLHTHLTDAGVMKVVSRTDVVEPDSASVH
jgi:UTP:GlnB (protein PII) uridylyltransferase